jgi:lipopolysaccharide biosynthesis regulator YciM
MRRNNWPSRSPGSAGFLSAYDFLASVHEAQGRLDDAQHALQRAADASPHNTVRQRMVGDVAMRNKDMLTAEKAYGKVIERSKGSSLRTVDDFANLSRVLVERGHIDASRKIAADMKREWRGDKQAELAALVTESLCLHAEGAEEKARGWSIRHWPCSSRPGRKRQPRAGNCRSG